MNDKNRQSKIDAIVNNRRNRLTSHIYLIYWDMQDWTGKKWAEDGWSDINIDHLKLLHLIATGESRSNSELAKLAGVTKQSMSQMVGLLEKRGVVVVNQNPNDSRSKLVSLSEYGFDFMEYFSTSTEDLLKGYEDVLGKDEMDVLTKITLKLSEAILKRQANRIALNR